MRKTMIIVMLFLIILLVSCSQNEEEYETNLSIEEKMDNFVIEDNELLEYKGQANVVTIPEGVKVIKEDSFKDKKNLYSLIIPETVEEIEEKAFSGCMYLVEIFNSSSLKLTSGEKDNGEVALNALTIKKELGNSEIELSNGGFVSLKINRNNYLITYQGNREKIIVPLGITIINKRAFYEFVNLSTVMMSSSVKIIEEEAFAYCDNLYQVVLGQAVESIGIRAFYNDNSLATITLQTALHEVQDYAFLGCYRLLEIYNLSKLDIEKGSDEYGYLGMYATTIKNSLSTPSNIKIDEEFVIFEDENKMTMLDYRGRNNRVVIPSYINRITKISFKDYNDLVSLAIGVGVEEIEEDSFKEQYHLVEVYNLSGLNNNIFPYAKDIYTKEDEQSKLLINNNFVIYRTILEDDNSFDKDNEYEVRSLLYVRSDIDNIIIENVKTVDDYAFYGKDIESIVIDDSVFFIKKDVFDNSNIHNVFYNGTKEQFMRTEITVPEDVSVYYYSAVAEAGCWHYNHNEVEIWGE